MRERDEPFLRALLELAPDAMIGVDPTGTIVLMNARVEDLFGYTRDELLGRPVELLVPARLAAAHPHHRQAYFADPRQRPMGAGAQLVARRKDNTEFPADISLSAIDTPTGPLVSAAIRDVSDRIEAERERQRFTAQAERDREERRRLQTQRLESLGQLAGGVAHDFNNLLAVISNYAAFAGEALEHAASRHLDPALTAARADIAHVERAAEAAAALTRQLLAFARRDVVRPQVLDLNTVVDSVTALLGRTIGEDIELEVDTTSGISLVEADPGQIHQILMNVVINARHAMPDGGLITIETADVVLPDGAIGALPAGSYVSVAVTDTGRGMDPETVSRAFEPFFTTKPRGEGSGLGLATVYGIVTRAGGDVDLQSGPGSGTRFAAYFPAVDSSRRVPEPARPLPGPTVSHAGQTVLVLDDEPALRELAARVLRRHGYVVLVAAGGEEAIRLARDHTGEIDALVTDVVMPRLSGPVVAEEIRAMRPGIGVLFVSGYARDELASAGRLHEGVDLLEKPFGELDLLAALRSVLERPHRRA